MDLKDIMAISGKPGLYKFVAQGRNAIIVEHIETGKRNSAFSTERINSLEEITIFTNEKDISLKEVFKSIFEKEEGKESIPTKSDAETLKTYFAEVVPDYDRDRVYVSDIKKILTWYNLLLKNELLSFEEEEPGEEKKREAPAVETDPNEEQQEKKVPEDERNDKSQEEKKE